MLPKQTIELLFVKYNSRIEPGQYPILLKDRLSCSEFDARVTKINTVIAERIKCNNVLKSNPLQVLFIVVIPVLLGFGMLVLSAMRLVPIPINVALGIHVGIVLIAPVVVLYKRKRPSSSVEGVIEEFNGLDKSKNITWRLTAKDAYTDEEIEYSELYAGSVYGRGHTNIVAIDIEPLLDNMDDDVDETAPLTRGERADMNDDMIVVPEPNWSKDIV